MWATTVPATRGDGRRFALKEVIEVLNVQVGMKGSIAGAIDARDRAAMAFWFKHRAQLCCCKIPLAERIATLCSTI